MKKVKRLLYISFMFASTSFAQTTSFAVAEPKSELMASKEDGDYSFLMPSQLTQTDIQNNAKYYTRYFTVDFNEQSKEAQVLMVTNDDKSRHIVIRFLTACGVQRVKVDGVQYNLEEFFNSYMR